MATGTKSKPGRSTGWATSVVSWRSWVKAVVYWECGNVLYLSVPFTWLLPQAAKIASQQRDKFERIVAGGPAVKLMGAPWADETPDKCPFDVLAMHNPLATFTTRGCPNKCTFCAVPKIEGDFRELSTWKPGPIICDNNLIAASKRHFKRVINSLKPFPTSDFNQGLDARLFTPWHAEQIAKLQNPKVRFSFDHISLETKVADAVKMTKAAGLTNITVYALIGYKDTPADALHRFETIHSWGVLTGPMRFQPLDAKERNTYVAPGWTDRELRRMSSYYSQLIYWGHIPYKDYCPHGSEIPSEDGFLPSSKLEQDSPRMRNE